MKETKTLKVKASDESMQNVNDFIHSMLPADCDEMLLNQIDLAVEEIFVNIAHYSGAEEATVIAVLMIQKMAAFLNWHLLIRERHLIP